MLPRAYRNPLHLTSCYGRLYEAGKFFGWLDQRGIATLAELDTTSARNTWRSGAMSSTPTALSWASRAPASGALPRR